MPETSGLAVRRLESADWEDVLRLADRAAPWSLNGNREWLANRQEADQSRVLHVHRVIIDPAGTVVAFVGVERTAQSDTARVFVVMRPEDLDGPPGEAAWTAVASELPRQAPAGAWAQEDSRDPLIPFFRRHGFVETTRAPYSAGQAVRLDRPPG